jgi:hypothetical protein
MGNDPARVIGIETKNSFNGTWGTDAKWHKMFYTDLKPTRCSQASSRLKRP